LPDIPTLHELGYPYHGSSTELYLITAPKGIPPAVAKKLENAFLKGMETPEFRTVAENFFVYNPNPLSSQKLKEYIEQQYAKNGDIIRRAKLSK
jgi:tripartite-type tricarboxylate transporter receptor subunit TctC